MSYFTTFFAFVTIVFLLVFTEHITGNDDNCLQYFTKKGYVPKFADNVKSSNLQVQYMGKNITCGSTANLAQTVNPPTLYYNAPSCCKNITVLAVTPDTNFFPPFLIWLTMNIPADNLRKGFTTPIIGNTENNGYNAANYDIPKEPTGSIATRTLLIFVYCQCGYFSDKTSALNRGNFDVKEYAKRNRLGTPMAGFYHFGESAGVDLRNQTKGVPDVLLP